MARTKTTTPPPPSLSIPKLTIPSNSSPSLGRTMMEGFAFGTGSSVARTITQPLFEKKPSHDGGDDDGMRDWCKTLKNEMLKCVNANDYKDLFAIYERTCRHDYTNSEGKN